MKKPASKVAYNPTRPRVLTPASIWLCGTETVFSLFFLIFDDVKLQSLWIALQRYLISNHSPLFSLVLKMRLHAKLYN